jgi:hypothetical protein
LDILLSVHNYYSAIENGSFSVQGQNNYICRYGFSEEVSIRDATFHMIPSNLVVSFEDGQEIMIAFTYTSATMSFILSQHYYLLL